MDTRFWNAPGLDGALNGALYAYKRLRQYLNQAPLGWFHCAYDFW